MNQKVIYALFLGVCFQIQYSGAILRKKVFPSTAPANFLAVELNDKTSFANQSGALFLTPYIKAGKLEQARTLSEVNLSNDPLQIKSYSGFLTVNEEKNSNMFFWFFPAKTGKTKDVPVLLWLQGGPGGSSLFGLFVENGPIIVNKNLQVLLRDFSWNEEFAVIYIDNPVGTGFSFTNGAYAKNEIDVARDLYEALSQFFTLFDSYKGNPFFVTGESYAGKYVPAISYKIHKMGQHAKDVGINLQGMAIGDGLCDPRNMLNYGEYLYQVGLLDELQRDFFFEQQEKAAKFIDNKEFFKAFQIFDFLLNGDLINEPSYFTNITGLTFYYNFLYDTQPDDFNYYVNLLSKKEIRDSIHVGTLPYSDGTQVEKHLLDDVMNSVKPWIEELLDSGLRSLFYSGQLDIIVAAPLTENFLKNLKWKRAEKYKDAIRTIYKVDTKDVHVAGYSRKVDNLYQITIRNAGHILPYDQPRVAHDMITRFVKNIDF